jgi:hypothetical protein
MYPYPCIPYSKNLNDPKVVHAMYVKAKASKLHTSNNLVLSQPASALILTWMVAQSDPPELKL